MRRRNFLKSLAVPAALMVHTPRAEASLPKAKITRVRIYKPPRLNELFNQSNMICTVETDIGITGIGEGGSKDTLDVGGITEMMKIAAICETHAVGIIPHFTGPIGTAALVNCLSTFSGPVLLEHIYGGRPIEHLPECLDFKDGKAYANDRPGLGVTAEMKLLTQIGEVTQPGRKNFYVRPDGSLTNW